MKPLAPENTRPLLPPHKVEKAVRLSCAQAMLGSIYGASTGGMFLIGYALQLGANNVQIGLMSTIPTLAVITQLFSAYFIERGISRRSMTIIGALLNVSGWALVVALPRMTPGVSAGAHIAGLIAAITVIAVFAQIAGNARGSWVGDLIPADMRGSFFGRMAMYGGIIGTFFALAEGSFLDRVKHAGIDAFGWLFFFGMLFGMTSALLFLPQADVPVLKAAQKASFRRHVWGTFRNGPLMAMMLWQIVWSLQSIAGPFYATYVLRDLKMPFLGLGLLNAAGSISMLAFAPFWGRMIDRFGCRPVLVATALAVTPIPFFWVFVNSPAVAYALVLPLNLWGGFCSGGISVASGTLIYKLSSEVGRSVQFAVYSIVVNLLMAPMPTLGGHLPQWLQTIGIGANLKATFYVGGVFALCGVLIARRIPEEGSQRIRDLLRDLLSHLPLPVQRKHKG